MSPKEHYAAAEQAINQAQASSARGALPEAAMYAAIAQAHATLAAITRDPR